MHRGPTKSYMDQIIQKERRKERKRGKEARGEGERKENIRKSRMFTRLSKLKHGNKLTHQSKTFNSKFSN